MFFDISQFKLFSWKYKGGNVSIIFGLIQSWLDWF